MIHHGKGTWSRKSNWSKGPIHLFRYAWMCIVQDGIGEGFWTWDCGIWMGPWISQLVPYASSCGSVRVSILSDMYSVWSTTNQPPKGLLLLLRCHALALAYQKKKDQLQNVLFLSMQRYNVMDAFPWLHHHRHGDKKEYKGTTDHDIIPSLPPPHTHTLSASESMSSHKLPGTGSWCSAYLHFCEWLNYSFKGAVLII